MTTTLTIGNQSCEIDNSLRAKSGGIIKISDYCAMKGLTLNKESRKEFALAKRAFFKNNRRAIALAAADDSFDVTRVKPIYSKRDGGFVGFDFAVRQANDESKPVGPSEAEIIEAAATRLAAKLGCSIEDAREMFSK
jgi:hypothetical protein